MNKNNSEPVELAYCTYDGSDEMMPPLTPIVIVHGTFDCKENWRHIAKTISDKLIRKVYVVDLRNHGTSPRRDDLSFTALVNDIELFLSNLNEPVVLVGHSVGGSAASAIAFKKPELVEKLILIDVSPIHYPADVEEKVSLTAQLMKQAVISIPKVFTLDEAKLVIEKRLQNVGMSKGFRKLLMGTLIKTKDGIEWKSNINSIVENFCVTSTVGKAYPLKGSYNKEVLFVYGELSSYVSPQKFEAIRKVMPNSTFRCIPDSDHWIHMEKPDDLIYAIKKFLNRY